MTKWQAAYASGSRAHATPFMHPQFARAWLGAVGGQDRYRPFFLQASHSCGQRVLWLFVAAANGWRHVRECVPIGSAIQPYSWRSQLAGYFEPIIVNPRQGPGGLLAPHFWKGFIAALREGEADWFDDCRIARFRTGLLGTPEGAEPYTAAPFLNLAPYDGIEGYIAARRPKVRSSIRRRMRRIEERGAVRLVVHDPADIEGISAWLPKLATERERRHGSKALPGDFTRRLVTEMRDTGMVHCSTLTLDGREISWKLGYLHDGVYYGYYRAFDPDFAAVAPGQVHFHLLVENLMAAGVHTIHFGIGTQDYKYEWTDGEEATMASLTLHSRAPVSVARRSMASTMMQVRRLTRALPLRATPGPSGSGPRPVPAGSED